MLFSNWGFMFQIVFAKVTKIAHASLGDVATSRAITVKTLLRESPQRFYHDDDSPAAAESLVLKYFSKR